MRTARDTSPVVRITYERITIIQIQLIFLISMDMSRRKDPLIYDINDESDLEEYNAKKTPKKPINRPMDKISDDDASSDDSESEYSDDMSIKKKKTKVTSSSSKSAVNIGTKKPSSAKKANTSKHENKLETTSSKKKSVTKPSSSLSSSSKKQKASRNIEPDPSFVDNLANVSPTKILEEIRMIRDEMR
jgi:hypothetical protein